MSTKKNYFIYNSILIKTTEIKPLLNTKIKERNLLFVTLIRSSFYLIQNVLESHATQALSSTTCKLINTPQSTTRTAPLKRRTSDSFRVCFCLQDDRCDASGGGAPRTPQRTRETLKTSQPAVHWRSLAAAEQSQSNSKSRHQRGWYRPSAGTLSLWQSTYIQKHDRLDVYKREKI